MGDNRPTARRQINKRQSQQQRHRPPAYTSDAIDRGMVPSAFGSYRPSRPIVESPPAFITAARGIDKIEEAGG
jgi:hypothetical protein